MPNTYYKIEPDLTIDDVAYIDGWAFTYWPNKPKGGVIQNPDGTYSVWYDKDMVPLVEQLKALFADGKAPESGTYIGEAELTGKLAPGDCIGGNFINDFQGIVVSNNLLALLQTFTMGAHTLYALPLIRKKKWFHEYSFVLFREDSQVKDADITLIRETNRSVVCVAEEVKQAMFQAGMRGCTFTPVHTVD